MIYKYKSEIVRHLECWRWKVDDMIKRNEIKELYVWEKKIWYVIVLDFIRYLLIK